MHTLCNSIVRLPVRSAGFLIPIFEGWAVPVRYGNRNQMHSLGALGSSGTPVGNIALIKSVCSITHTNRLGDGGTLRLNSKACIWREKNKDEIYWQIPM